jgi:hypothetical protein
MRTIAEWQKTLREAADRKFPRNADRSQQDWVVSNASQLDDVKNALLVEQGLLTSSDHGHQDPNHRIGALIADVLILAEIRGADVERELEKVLEWFEKR